jgi:CP family cyanate transporter-like MFS transporter
LDEKSVALLTGLPVLLLALAAVPGSLLIAQVGARRALLAGLVLVAVGGALRGIGPSTRVLFAMTLLMGLGIALIQPSFPSIVRQWFPERTGQATAVYANGLLLGEILAASLTIPILLPLVHGSWELALAFWSLPVAATAVLILLATPHTRRHPQAAPVRWWPDWTDGRTWRVGLILGCASMLYFGTNAFIPDYFRASHRAALIPLSLAVLNTGQLPASVLVGMLPHRLVGRRRVFLATAGLTLISVLGFLLMPGLWAVFWVAALGFCAGLVLVLSLALPPLLTGPDDVHRISAGMFTIAYLCSFSAPLLAGALWDATGLPVLAFLPALVSGPAMLLLAGGLSLPRPQRVTVPAEVA